jgi:hypothetical protein
VKRPDYGGRNREPTHALRRPANLERLAPRPNCGADAHQDGCSGRHLGHPAEPLVIGFIGFNGLWNRAMGMCVTRSPASGVAIDWTWAPPGWVCTYHEATVVLGREELSIWEALIPSTDEGSSGRSP